MFGWEMTTRSGNGDRESDVVLLRRLNKKSLGNEGGHGGQSLPLPVKSKYHHLRTMVEIKNQAQGWYGTWPLEHATWLYVLAARYV
jgi:hypothetical protein